jgi:hypothetical protein
VPLSDTTVRMAKPRLKTYKLSDAHGLYLEVAPNGSLVCTPFDRRPGGLS